MESAVQTSSRQGELAWQQNLFTCPTCKRPLVRKGVDLEMFSCGAEHSFPIVRGIPRFVGSDLYVDSFSFEWNTHNTTQLDSHRGGDSSEEMFRIKTGLTPEQVKGKLVLDAGVGAGRFSDVLARWGAKVVGVDLSYAVEASYQNFKHLDNVVIAQGDIGRLPFAEETFDFIVSIGVLHHTPNTKEYFQKLVPLLKRGGSIAIWVYPNEGDYITRTQWIPYTYKIPDKMFYEWCRWFVPLANKRRTSNLVQWISKVFPFSYQGLGIENDILDTFDGYSPRFHGIHSTEEVKGWFEESGLVNIREPGNWTTSVRGDKPA
jgi:SAM-dependent methyltransferase